MVSAAEEAAAAATGHISNPVRPGKWRPSKAIWSRAPRLWSRAPRRSPVRLGRKLFLNSLFPVLDIGVAHGDVGVDCRCFEGLIVSEME